MRNGTSGVPYSPQPISVGKTASDVDDESRLSWQRPDDVTPEGQSAADLYKLIDCYGRLNTTGNLPVDPEPKSDEVQRLIKVCESHRSKCNNKRSNVVKYEWLFVSIRQVAGSSFGNCICFGWECDPEIFFGGSQGPHITFIVSWIIEVYLPISM